MKDDLISREAALNAVNERIKQIGYENDPLVLSIRQAVRELPAAQPPARWISVSEKPPEIPCIEYLAAGHLPRIKMAAGMFTYETDEHGVFYADSDIVGIWADVSRIENKKYSMEHIYQSRIIAWMPLPGPYEEEQDA